MNPDTAMAHTLADIFRRGGNWSQVYLDVSVDTGDPAGVTSSREESVSDALRRAGAPEADIEAIEAVMDEAPAVPSPVSRFILATNGDVVLDEVVPGRPVDAENVSYGSVPNVIPLLKQRPEPITYVVVETSRDGGEVRLYRAGEVEPLAEDRVTGRTDTLHKAQSGGWRQSHNQNHVEEIWKQTQSELASTVDEIVRRHNPRLLVVAGDIRARQLLADQLSSESQAILSVEPTNTRADGASDEALVEHIDEELRRVLEDDTSDVADRLAIHKGRGDNTTEYSVGAIVQALAGAQVDTLVLDTTRLREHTLLALDAEPWIASAPEDALNASVLDTVPAAVAMVRAALLTDATVIFADSEDAPDDGESGESGDDAADDSQPALLPEDAPAAALLRWRTGPPVPGT